MSKLIAALFVSVTLSLSIMLTGCVDGDILVGKNVEETDDITLPIVDSCVVESSEVQSEKHEHGKIFSFQPKGSTAPSNVKPFCESGECRNLGYTLFRGTPNDLSYLGAIEEHSDGSGMIGGEYYTVTATVVLADYDFTKTRVRCQVQSDNIIVNFSVEFRDGFEESVALVDEGDEITFRGRFYDEGCGFTDSELIIK